MQIQIIDTPLTLHLTGLSKKHDPAKSYGEDLIGLLNVVWEKIKSRGVPNTGINHFVYDKNDVIFAGIIVTDPNVSLDGLESREIVLQRYASYTYVGPYSALPDVNAQVKAEIHARSLVTAWPMIEIYGHWNEDPAKLETELIYPLA